MKYFLVVGETSGDIHASHLMRSIMAHDPAAQFQYFGGDEMAQVAPGCVKHSRELAIMGFWEVITHLRKVMQNLALCIKAIEEFAPDVVVLVDFPGFNFRIAKQCKKRGIKVFYYIAPKVWAWKESRVRLIQQYVDQLFIIFPFEKAYFRGHGVEAIYEGNPLIDQLPTNRSEPDSLNLFIKKHQLDERPKIALLPGSRKQEIRANLPIMEQLAEQHSEFQFVVAMAPSIPLEIYTEALSRDVQMGFVTAATHELMQHSVAGIITSGTATLEAALLGLPQVVVYKANPISVSIARRFVKVPFISLVNLIMGREVVCELIQQEFTLPMLSREFDAILPNGCKREAQLEEYTILSGMLGEKGVAQRIAGHMFHILTNK